MPATRTPAPPDALALPAWLMIQRLRPVTLKTVTRYLRQHARLAAALKLLRQYFPDEMENTAVVVKVDPAGETGLGWWEVMARVANLAAKEDWFVINWDAFNEAWAWWVEKGDNGDRLAVFLEFIPVKLYGFVGEMLFECPPMELLHALLAPEGEVNAISAQLLQRAGMDEELDEIWFDDDRQRAWALLQTVENQPDQYPQPVRWLPELARWACRQTGNVLLDRRFDPYGAGPWFRWEDDLARVQSAWQRARPVVDVLERVRSWVEADDNNLPALARFLMRGASTDRLDW